MWHRSDLEQRDKAQTLGIFIPVHCKILWTSLKNNDAKSRRVPSSSLPVVAEPREDDEGICSTGVSLAVRGALRFTLGLWQVGKGSGPWYLQRAQAPDTGAVSCSLLSCSSSREEESLQLWLLAWAACSRRPAPTSGAQTSCQPAPDPARICCHVADCFATKLSVNHGFLLNTAHIRPRLGQLVCHGKEEEKGRRCRGLCGKMSGGEDVGKGEIVHQPRSPSSPEVAAPQSSGFCHPG